MEAIIISIICNLIVVAILVNGIFSTLRGGWRIAIAKFALFCGGALGAYFLTPILSNGLLSIPYGDMTLAEPLKIALGLGVINSVIFTLLFLVFYTLNIIACGFIKRLLIKSLKEKGINSAKMQRARSINHKVDVHEKRKEWKALKLKYNKRNVWWKKLISGSVGAIISIVVGMIAILPYGYAAERINHKGNKEHLEKGYSYTLNGVLDEHFENLFDWIISVEESLEPEESKGQKLTDEESPRS